MPAGDRSAIDALDDAMQPGATRAQPEALVEDRKLRKSAGVPNLRQLEPDSRMA
jgi:hypothetical protein